MEGVHPGSRPGRGFSISLLSVWGERCAGWDARSIPTSFSIQTVGCDERSA